jgi:uncharacterized protein (DUF2062 family)
MTRWINSFRGLDDRPYAIALGASIGTFIAFTPTIGIQTFLAFFGATLFRVSRPAAIIPVWISNPLTIGPIFTFTYWVGMRLWPGGGSGFELFQPAEVYATGVGVMGVTTAAVQYSGNLLLTLIVGGCAVGLFCAVITYPCVKLLAERWQRHQFASATRNNVTASPSS